MFVCALGFGTFASSRAVAQELAPVKVAIPFGFQAGSVRMPAGLYRIANQSGTLGFECPKSRAEKDVVLAKNTQAALQR